MPRSVRGLPTRPFAALALTATLCAALTSPAAAVTIPGDPGVAPAATGAFAVGVNLTASGVDAPAGSSAALDPALTVRQPGDSPATAAARAKLAAVAAKFELAGAAYAQALTDQQAADARAARARAAHAAALSRFTRARDQLGQFAAQTYMDGSTSSLATLVSSGSFTDALDRATMLDQVGATHAGQTDRAHAAQAAMRQADYDAAVADAAAATALNAATQARMKAQAALAQAQQIVSAAHLADQAAAAAAAASAAQAIAFGSAGGGNSIGDAATAIRAQAIAAGAARAADFPAGSTPAATIATATGAILHQAAAASATVAPGAFVRPTTVPNTTTLMGAAPSLPAATAKVGHASTATGLALFTTGLPLPSSPGVGLAGAAPVLKADGVNVHPKLPVVTGPQVRAQVAVDAALSVLGSPYVWAAAGPNTFDCSGLTMWAWAHAGVALDHYTGNQLAQTMPVTPSQILPGDLVFFGSDVHHVGMYLGAGYMIDAPHTGAYVRVEKVAGFDTVVGIGRP